MAQPTFFFFFLRHVRNINESEQTEKHKNVQSKACIEFNRGRAQRPFPHQRFSGQIFKNKNSSTQKDDTALSELARDARGRRASRLKVHTSYHTHLRDLWTPLRGCKVRTPPMIVPPSSSRSPSVGLLHPHKRRNPAVRVHRKKRRAVYLVCACICPLLCSVRRARDSARGPMLEKEANSFRFLGRHTGPQQWSHTEQKHSHFRPVYHATLDWGRQKRKKRAPH